MNRREAYIILNLVPGVGPVRVKQLLRYFETPEAILAEKATSLARVHGIGKKIAEVIANWANEVNLRQEIELANRAGVDLVTQVDPEYPELLKEIYDPPLCLYVRGIKSALKSPLCLAVVGSRRTSRYGTSTAERLSISATQAGWTIVSGLALGIDTAAHAATVDVGGVTIAVLAGGLGRIYPQVNIPLARKITDHGALISEQPMNMSPDKRAFPMRNRIIAGMSSGTLVIEAGARSGALITAQQAIDQGRSVFAVPGRVDSPTSRGCHRLLKDGATLVETIDDVLEEFNFLPQLSASRSNTGPERKTSRLDQVLEELTENEQKLVDVLRDGEKTIDEIFGISEIPIPEILAILLRLELKRVVYQLPGKRYELMNPGN